MAGNREALFNYLDENFRAVAADELTLVDERPSDLDWKQVSLTSRLSRSIGAPVPILTSPMSTISEDEMGIAAAKQGGGAVIHHANTPEEQKQMVRRVKLHLNGVIDEPVTVRSTDTVEGVLNEVTNRGLDFRTLPVIDADNKVVGLMTNTLFELFRNEDKTKQVTEVMYSLPEIAGAIATTDEVSDVHDVYELMKQKRNKLLMIIDESHTLREMYLLSDVLRAVEGNPQNYNLDENGRLRTFMSVSTFDKDAADRVRLCGKYIDMVVIDTSHGESPYTFNTLRRLKELRASIKNLKEEHANIDVMVGNVSDPALAAALAKEGPDAIRVGRGPGGICISREKLGGGMPQASAVYLCAKAVRAVNPEITICADGGIRGPGDMVKYLALGASCVMVGSYVAGTDEAAAPVMTRADGSQYKEYNGMGSAKEQRRSSAARLRYNAPRPGEDGVIDVDADEIFVEGVEKEIPLQGPVARKFKELTRGTKTEMATGGYATVAELQENVSFRLVTSAAASEGGASK